MIEDAFLRDQGGADALVEGYYLIQRLRAERVALPVKIWFGAPLDPDTGLELDRSPRWQILIGGAVFDQPLKFGGISVRELGDFWPSCARSPIDEIDYLYRVERAAWAAEHDPNDALGKLGERIDPMTCTLPGM